MLRPAANDSLTARSRSVQAPCYRRHAVVEARVEFRILGAMEVLEGTRRVALPAGRGRALLALLVLHAGEAVTADRLIDELWGEHAPSTAGTVVQGLVSRLRKELEPSRGRGEPSTLLQTVGRGYLLAISPDAVDADRFKRLVDEARSGAPELRSAKLTDALGLWHGPALADFRYEPFAQLTITALEELRLTAIEERIEIDFAFGRVGDPVAELTALIRAHPFRERLRELQMLALYRAGRQADALQAYRDAHTVLNEELGIDPDVGGGHPSTGPRARAGDHSAKGDPYRGTVVAARAASGDGRRRRPRSRR